MNLEGSWYSIPEYSKRFDVSVSTLRRRIKSGQVQFKMESGKYLIFEKNLPLSNLDLNKLTPNEQYLLKINKEVSREVSGLREEVNELKMLVALYESSPLSDRELPPDLPPELKNSNNISPFQQ